MNFMKDKTLQSRIYGTVALNSAPAIELNGRRYLPDETKAYASFTVGRSFPVVTAYGTAVHPGTVANSFQTMLHQLVDYDHQLKLNSQASNKDIREDRIIGAVVDVDYPKAPYGGWKVGMDKGQAPAINGVMVIHKKADKVKQVLGEHLAGRHKWTVSMEMGYNLLKSGYIVSGLEHAKKSQLALMEEQTPKELSDLGLGYVAIQSAPDDLVDCFSLDKLRIVSNWGNCPVCLLQGGLNGETHFGGVGIVRYGAEREAEINEILARDPDRLMSLDSEELLAPTTELHKSFLAGFAKAGQALERLFKI